MFCPKPEANKEVGRHNMLYDMAAFLKMAALEGEGQFWEEAREAETCIMCTVSARLMRCWLVDGVLRPVSRYGILKTTGLMKLA